ncbi:response regulator transcription factor [Cohnella pontilimi]|uniref:Response regulator transcription factor n=1 Tax=Cohnella pontilimi TaxID=2564100 RepID=A0A4U0F5Z1_9BACL|nr:response regulator transcription factor [Cohnella pontilimi]
MPGHNVPASPAIAERLVISPKTVRNHVSTIFSKFFLNDHPS